MQETPSRSSPRKPVEPLQLEQPAGLVQQARLLEVAALSLRPEALSALQTVLEAERDYHLRAAAFCEEAELRAQHRGVLRWLEEWMSGALLDRYRLQAEARLGLAEAEKADADGSPWMESDGLGEPAHE